MGNNKATRYVIRYEKRKLVVQTWKRFTVKRWRLFTGATGIPNIIARAFASGDDEVERLIKRRSRRKLAEHAFTINDLDIHTILGRRVIIELAGLSLKVERAGERERAATTTATATPAARYRAYVVGLSNPGSCSSITAARTDAALGE